MNMPHTARNFFIWCTTVTGITFVYRTLVKRRGALTRVLVFHDVRDRVWFDTVLSYINTHYHILTPQEFSRAEFDQSKINILMTFDDGYASWVNVCLPILETYRVKALFFINSGLIDLYEKQEELRTYVRENLLLCTPRETLSWDGVKELVEAGHTIGGHTVRHARLSSLSESEQREEIMRDKKRIEAILEKQVTLFAYPFGRRSDYTEMTENLVREARYAQAFTTEATFAVLGDSYQIPRLCIEDNLRTSTLSAWIEGGYDIFANVARAVRD